MEAQTSTSGRLGTITDESLRIISKQIGYWKELALRLRFTDAEIWNFRRNNPNDIADQAFKMLIQWRNKQPPSVSQIDTLCEAVKEIGRKDLAVFLYASCCQTLDDDFFLYLSREIGRQWKTLAINLCFDDEDIKRIEADHPGDIKEQAHRMLATWRRQQEDQARAYEQLRGALKKSGRFDFAMESFATLGQTLDDDFLLYLSREIGGHWKALASNLGFGDVEVQRIEVRRPGDIPGQAHRMLATWRRQEEDQAKVYAKLRGALKKLGRIDLAMELLARETLDDEVFLNLSRKIGKQWKTLAINVGFGDEDIQRIEADHPGDIHEQAHRMLATWRSQQEDQARAFVQLRGALQKSGRSDLAMESFDKLGKTLEDEVLLNLSREIGKQWEAVAINLSFGDGDVQRIKADHPGDIQEQARRMLVTWKRQQEDQARAYVQLRGALTELGRIDLAIELFGIVPAWYHTYYAPASIFGYPSWVSIPPTLRKPASKPLLGSATAEHERTGAAEAEQSTTMTTSSSSPKPSPTHLQMVLNECSRHAENLSEIRLLETRLQLPYMALGYFNKMGGRLSLYDVHLTIPRGAIPGDSPQLVYIYVNPKTLSWDGLIKPEELALSSVIQCGPPNLEFAESVVMSFSHHAAIFSGEVEARMRQDEPAAENWRKFDGNYVVINERVILLVDHFTLFALVGTPSLECRKRVVIGVFAGSSDGQHALRVHIWNDDQVTEQNVLTEERKSPLVLVRGFEFNFGQGDIAVEVEDIGQDCKRKGIISKENVKTRTSNSVTVQFTPQSIHPKQAGRKLSCYLNVYQYRELGCALEESKVRLPICLTVPPLETDSHGSCSCPKDAAANLCSVCKEKIEAAFLRKQYGEIDVADYGGLSEKALHRLFGHLDNPRDGCKDWRYLAQQLTSGDCIFIRQAKQTRHPTKELLKVFFEVRRSNGVRNSEAIAQLTMILKEGGLSEAAKIIKGD